MHHLSPRPPSSAPSRLSVSLLSLLVCSVLVSGCDRGDQRGLNDRQNTPVSSSERKASEVVAAARQAGSAANQAVVVGSEKIGNSAKDVAITAEVKTRLARDTQLSALAINVDTADGRVTLRGTAPDTASRNRATDLARGVDGVGNVNNELTVQAR